MISYGYLVFFSRKQLHTTARVLTSDYPLTPLFAGCYKCGSVGAMLSSIKEFHQSRLLKEAHELEEKAKAEKGSRADAESEARYGSVQQYWDIVRTASSSLGRALMSTAHVLQVRVYGLGLGLTLSMPYRSWPHSPALLVVCRCPTVCYARYPPVSFK